MECERAKSRDEVGSTRTFGASLDTPSEHCAASCGSATAMIFFDMAHKCRNGSMWRELVCRCSFWRRLVCLVGDKAVPVLREVDS